VALGLLLPVTFLKAPIHGVIINWFGPLWLCQLHDEKTLEKPLRFDFFNDGRRLSQQTITGHAKNRPILV